jgi:hypothetical protein
MSDEIKLDRNTYGDLDRYLRMVGQVARWTHKLWEATESEKLTADEMETLIYTAENFVGQAAACKAYWEAYHPNEEFCHATKSEIAKAIAGVIDSYPATRINNPRAYVSTLVEEIYLEQPSPITVESACRELRRTLKTPPSIAAMLEMLKKHHGEQEDHWHLWEFDEALADARTRLAKLREQAEREANVPPTQCGFRLRQQVYHPEHGTGTIVEIDEDDDPIVKFERLNHTIAFCGGGKGLSHEPIKPRSHLSPGERVQHQKFGIGTIAETDGHKLTVDFTIGRKAVLDSFVERVEMMAEAAE